MKPADKRIEEIFADARIQRGQQFFPVPEMQKDRALRHADAFRDIADGEPLIVSFEHKRFSRIEDRRPADSVLPLGPGAYKVFSHTHITPLD